MQLPEFRLEAYFARWEFAARHHLTASDAEALTVEELLALGAPADRDRLMRLPLRYVESAGTPELRAAVAATYEGIDPEDVLCFAGAEEALFCALQTLLAPGDHAVVLVPNYQSMESVPGAICEVSGVALRPENGWRLDVDEVRAAVRPSTRVVAVNFPNNPTGMNLPAADFRALAEFCAERGIAFFSDEVYRGIERDPAKTLPQAAELAGSAISLNVVSKAYGLPGLRVGWIACRDRSLLARMARLKDYLSICNAAPSELLAAIAVSARERIFARNRAIVEENLALLRAFFARHADRFAWYEPDGGCIAFPQYRGGEGVETFCGRAVEEAGVLLLPASLYRSELAPVPEDRLRIGYGRRGMAAGLEALDAFIKRTPAG